MKNYSVRYFLKNMPCTIRVSTIKDVKNLIAGDASQSEIETKISENMPIKMHNLIAKHNEKFD
ncbi:MAG: hypothetical protein KBC56_04900 [Flavobacterium sp.]|nr:hypothetical protein [Flavobacterium sp.]